jgi:hypothetical protein
VTPVWIAIVIAGGAALIATLTSRHHRVDTTDFGKVSQQWLAEQRAGEHSVRNADR